MAGIATSLLRLVPYRRYTTRVQQMLLPASEPGSPLFHLQPRHCRVAVSFRKYGYAGVHHHTRAGIGANVSKVGETIQGWRREGG